MYCYYVSCYLITYGDTFTVNVKFSIVCLIVRLSKYFQVGFSVSLHIFWRFTEYYDIHYALHFHKSFGFLGVISS